MFGLQFLDVGLGLVMLYLLLSLTCTAATEIVSGILRLRARTLEKGITNLLRDPAIKEKIISHPLIRDLHKEGKKPAYIPARTFALSLCNILSDGDGLPSSKEIRSKIKKNLPEDSDLRRSLLVLVDEAGNDLKAFQKNIETWFNDSMDRVAGWYKTRAQIVTVVLALIIAGLTNADTMQWVKSLSNDPALREVLVAQATEYAKQNVYREDAVVSEVDTSVTEVGGGTGDSTARAATSIDTISAAGRRIQENIDEVRKLGIPLGWDKAPKGTAWISKIIGILLTTLAMSLGAPFWFDMLKRVVNIRSSGGLAGEAGKKADESK